MTFLFICLMTGLLVTLLLLVITSTLSIYFYSLLKFNLVELIAVQKQNVRLKQKLFKYQRFLQGKDPTITDLSVPQD